MTDDRRTDLDSRARVVALEQRYRRVARELTLGFAALTLGVVLALAVVWSVSTDNRDNARKLRAVVVAQRANRIDNTRAACDGRNAEHRVIRGLLQRSAVEARKLKSEGLINAEQLARNLRENATAQASFPIERDCATYARQTVR